MTYIGNDIYEIILNGQTIQCTADELKEAFNEIKTYEKNPTKDYIEPCDSNYIYEDSARFELLRTEIQDNGYKFVKWSDELNDVLETTLECAMQTAHNWYTSKYHMHSKY